ncbi:SU10 major capsid protein [Tautonia plasticadhaerens]|uniref:Phage capsid family protein n=1 Tax=Tautonia plasticadhaerens TaxID=2527974 RepID=A0A518HBQ2_9BACT|nr:DUF5309 family protein [Tautonia plasticadhaerens]QDV38275.1 hypothetical protein ElP_62260 [Tautonia plasticadhaerens]
MSINFLQGIQRASDHQSQIRNDVHVVATNWFVNRCPLATRLPRLPVGSTTFTLVNRAFRRRTTAVAAAVAAGDAQITLENASSFMVGDVLELPSGERVEVLADPNVSTHVVQVRRGAEGTTAAAAAIGGTVRLIGNSRTGGEVNQSAVALQPTGTIQYCQTFQHPVQVAGSLQSSLGYQTSPGIQTPFDQHKMDALQNLLDDMEVSAYYGLGESPTVAGRPKQRGLRSLLSSNKVTAPTNAGAYKPSDLIRDTLERCRANGGSPDVLLVSSNFMTGLAVWGHAAQRIDAGMNVFGVPIDVFEAPFLGGLSIIEAPLLRPFTAVALTSTEVRLRMKRNEYWNPRGSRGDALEGDWIAEGALEVENESHHAWLEGITAFSAT